MQRYMPVMTMMSKGRPRPMEMIIITRLENLSSGGVPYPIMKVLGGKRERINNWD